MIKRSLTGKLFVFIMILFLTQVFIQYGFQKYYLTDYYESQKLEKIEEQFNQAIESFIDADNIMSQIDVLYEYMATADEAILVFNAYQEFHQASYVTSFEQTVSIDIDSTVYLMPFNLSGYNADSSTITEIEELPFESEVFSYDLIGEKVIVRGVEYENNFTPYGFVYNGLFYDAYTYVDMSSEMTGDISIYDDESMVDVEKTGTIIDIQEKLLSMEIQKKINDLSEYYYQSLYGGDGDYSNYNVLTKKVEINGDMYTFVSALSLQPINEVLEVQSKFQLYLTVFMILLIVVISYIFSKVISKPIVTISQSTAEIAKLNFDVICDEKRTDEIGHLGKSINLLSKSLKDKIDTLEGEIEFERRQEKIRREFVADVSHELKTPLGVIRSYSEGIKDGISKERADYYLDVILEEVDKMNGLVLDMLELSKLESAQLIIKEHINIKRMVNNLLRSYEQIMESMNVQLELEDLFVDVDIKKMELVISNLLSNAFRYVDERKMISIKIKGNILSIENSHEIIDKSELNKLWNRFYRLEKSRSRTFGGNGLGLAIVQKTLDLHDLEYGIENSKIGFLFKIRF